MFGKNIKIFLIFCSFFGLSQRVNSGLFCCFAQKKEFVEPGVLKKFAEEDESGWLEELNFWSDSMKKFSAYILREDSSLLRCFLQVSCKEYQVLNLLQCLTVDQISELFLKDNNENDALNQLCSRIALELKLIQIHGLFEQRRRTRYFCHQENQNTDFLKLLNSSEKMAEFCKRREEEERKKWEQLVGGDLSESEQSLQLSVKFRRASCVSHIVKKLEFIREVFFEGSNFIFLNRNF